MVTFVVNTVGNLKFHWSKKRSDPLKGPVDSRNLISFITSLFKLLELFVCFTKALIQQMILILKDIYLFG